ncbi:MAG: hypothetical protein AB7I19_16030 [Planctomycetota bacterium]
MARSRSHLRKFDFLVAATVILGGVAILATILGFSLGGSGVDLAERRDSIAALTPLENLPAGETGWIEGVLDGSAPRDAGGLVVFVRERYVRRGREIAGTNTPSFDLVLDDGSRAHILNQDYAIDRALSKWAATSREEEPAGITTGALQITGIGNGDRIMVIGRRHELGIVAEAVAGLDRATYLARCAEESERLSSVRWWFFGAALLTGLLAVVLVLRVRRSLRTMSPQETRRRQAMDLA